MKTIEAFRINTVQEHMKIIEEINRPSSVILKIQEQMKSIEAYRLNTVQEEAKKMQAIAYPSSLVSQIDKFKKESLAMSQRISPSSQLEKFKKETFGLGLVHNIEKLKKYSLLVSQLANPTSQFEKLKKEVFRLGLVSQIELQRKEIFGLGLLDNLKKESFAMSHFVNFSSQFDKLSKEAFKTPKLFNLVTQTQEILKILESEYLTQNEIELIDNIHVNDDGTFFVGDESISQEKIYEYFNVDSINGFIEQFKSLSNPVVKAILIYLVIPYFVAIFANLTTAYWEEQWKEYSHVKTRELKKEIISAAKEKYDFQYLQEYRFVSTNILYVRNDKGTKANVIDELYLGKMVKLTDKTRSWCLIEYQDSDTNELKQGWVFSRYLSKFGS